METGTAVQKVPRSRAFSVLPGVAVMLALGGKTVRSSHGNVGVAFEGETVWMHEEDHALALKVAERIATQFRVEGRRISPMAVINAMGIAEVGVSEALAAPGVVKVLYYPSVSRASAYYRAAMPAMAVNLGDRVRADVTTQRTAREAISYDVVVLQLDASPMALKFAEALKAMGKKVIFELDDAFDALEKHHPRYEELMRPDAQARYWRMIEQADAVTVSSKSLANRITVRNDRVTVIPNMVPLSGWPLSPENETAEFRVLWAGSVSHGPDLAMIARELTAFAKDRDNVRLVFFGRKPPKLELPESQVRVLPFCDFAQYPEALAAVRADVALAPLADTPWNRAKSAIKLVEYGASGYPIIASAVGPYSDALAEDPEVCLPAGTSEGEWHDGLRFFYDNEDYRKKYSASAARFARRYDVADEKNRKAIEDFFVNLVR